MTTGRDVKDYWSYLEKIQDATDYVQEVLAENARLERRLAELEEENHTLRAQRSTLRRLFNCRRSRFSGCAGCGSRSPSWPRPERAPGSRCFRRAVRASRRPGRIGFPARQTGRPQGADP